MIVIFIKSIPDLHKINLTNGDKIRTVYVPTTVDKERYTAVKNELEEKYSLTLNNRDNSIKEIINVLTQGSNKTIPKLDLMITRTDISNFFPSVNKHSLYKKLMRNNYLSLNAVDTLKEFIFNNNVEGLPQGIPFSSILSEFYLQEFDSDFINAFTPYLYQRYVDDILFIKIISKHDKPIKTNQITTVIDDIARKHDLVINKNKTEVVFFKGKEKRSLDFDYLGYKFKSLAKDSNFELTISINETKFNKIWDNIYELFALYSNSDKTKADYWKLYYRLINHIYGVTTINDKNEVLKFGLGHSYKYVNNENQLKVLFDRISYQIYKSSLSSNENYSLHQIISYEHSPIEILSKRFDYMKLTKNQLNKMHRRIKSPHNRNRLESFFYYLYKI